MAMSVSLNGEIFEQVIYSKEADFEQFVVENAATIFGDKGIYIDTKKKVNTLSFGRTIPDGFLIDISDPEDPQFYLVEVELQSHDFFRHIFPQITRFFAFYREPKQRLKFIETMFSFFKNDTALANKLKDLSEAREIYKFLKDTVDNNQNVLIIIDGQKPEFKEIMDTYTDTWGRMVKVQVVKHYRCGENNIVAVEPPFQDLPFGDAVAPSPEEEVSEPTQYTEEFHLQNRTPVVIEIYKKLKETFIAAKESLQFMPTKNYIGVVDVKRIAYIQFKRNKVHLIVRMSEDEVGRIVVAGHHKVISFSESRRRYWGGSEPACGVDIYGINHWGEIQSLIEELVERFTDE